MSSSPITQHDLAYACFLPPAAISFFVLAVDAGVISNEAAGAFGMLLGVPIALMAAVSVPAAFILSFWERKDSALLVLSGLTILAFAAMFFSSYPSPFYLTAQFMYLFLVIAFETRWFLYTRGRTPEAPSIATSTASQRKPYIATAVHVLLLPAWAVSWLGGATAVFGDVNPVGGWLQPQNVSVAAGAVLWIKLLIDSIRWERKGLNVKWTLPFWWGLWTIFNLSFAIAYLFPKVRRRLEPKPSIPGAGMR